MTRTTAVVGGGVIGAAVAWHLARRGHDVVVFDQRRGGVAATAQSGGLLRLHHTADCDIALAARALPTFQRFGELVGGDCGYRPTGFALLVGPEHGEALRHNVDKVRAAGGKAEVVEPGALAARYPGLRLDGVAAAAYEPDGGYADPAATARLLLDAARAEGARVLDDVPVEHLLVRDDRVVGVRCSIGDVDVDAVVLAAGVWSAGLAEEVGVDLGISPRWIAIALAHAEADVPACIDDTTGNYFRPNGGQGVFFGVDLDPEDEPVGTYFPVRPELVTAARDGLWRRVPALADGPTVSTRVGVDGYTPDRHPVIGPVGPAGLYAATGLSGGGFKLAPAVGELVAHEVDTGEEHEELVPYRPGRFAAGEPIVGEHGYRWM
ncbi:NAD(P)/FAD-dependent oxidoreductase [Saccharothrix saharensis]|uniref:NAD(P)/FAD-dependent oxidoreductase n=1 Tax=Saccharothrix saharensis TaxID=571190 RepID=UPI0036BC9FC2